MDEPRDCCIQCLPKKSERDVAYVVDPFMALADTIMSVVNMISELRTGF